MKARMVRLIPKRFDEEMELAYQEEKRKTVLSKVWTAALFSTCCACSFVLVVQLPAWRRIAAYSELVGWRTVLTFDAVRVIQTSACFWLIYAGYIMAPHFLRKWGECLWLVFGVEFAACLEQCRASQACSLRAGVLVSLSASLVSRDSRPHAALAGCGHLPHSRPRVQGLHANDLG